MADVGGAVGVRVAGGWGYMLAVWLHSCRGKGFGIRGRRKLERKGE